MTLLITAIRSAPTLGQSELSPISFPRGGLYQSVPGRCAAATPSTTSRPTNSLSASSHGVVGLPRYRRPHHNSWSGGGLSVSPAQLVQASVPRTPHLAWSPERCCTSQAPWGERSVPELQYWDARPRKHFHRDRSWTSLTCRGSSPCGPEKTNKSSWTSSSQLLTRRGRCGQPRCVTSLVKLLRLSHELRNARSRTQS